jgi:heme oxygenase
MENQMATEPIMDRLRESTRAAHQAAEDNPLEKTLIRGELPRDRYVAWLGQRWLVHRALENALLKLRGQDGRLTNAIREDLFQAANLERDLKHFGVSTDTIEPVETTQKFVAELERTLREQPIGLLGYLYVFEGSKNGASMIARMVADAYDATRQAGLSYLDPHGDQQRPLWAQFKQTVNEISLEDNERAVIVDRADRAFVLVTALDKELYAGELENASEAN